MDLANIQIYVLEMYANLCLFYQRICIFTCVL